MFVKSLAGHTENEPINNALPYKLWHSAVPNVMVDKSLFKRPLKTQLITMRDGIK